MTPAAVLFDAGNTLVFLDYGRLASAIGTALGLPLTEAGLRQQAGEATRAMEQGRLTDRERGSVYLLTLFAGAGVPPSRTEELKKVLLDLHQRAHLWGATVPGTAEALERLKAAGVRLAVVSNSDGRAATALAAGGLLDAFEFVIDSGEVGVEKPDPRIFQMALERMGVNARDALYVGDLYEVDVVGARAAGLDVVLLDPAGEHAGRDVRTVRSVAELADGLLASRAAWFASHFPEPVIMARPRSKHEPAAVKASRLRALTEEYLALAVTLRAGGGAARVKRMHEKGQLSPRERVATLLDAGAPWLELGLLVAYDRYDGQAPGAGVITGLGVVEGREVVVVANDATVKAGSWWPETITKILRAQEVAMRQRIPIIYLVDSAGVNLPYQEGVFPGQYGAARIFYYNSLMRRYLRVPQISAVMGSCIAGGAYLPALSDVIFMVEGTSFMGLGGPNLVKGATGQTIDAETLGGARTHTELSAVAHYRAPTDAECLTRIRDYVGRLPVNGGILHARRDSEPPARDPADLYDVLPHDHRLSYDARQVLACLLDGGRLDEFQPDLAREMICGHGHIEGWPVAVIANARGIIRGAEGERPRFGGIIYTESAEKTAYFIETANRERLPILFVQDVSGFMVGADAEHSGIIRAGAHFVEAMATATVPKIVLTVNHASGAGYYAMAGQGFDPDFILSWPTGRMAVMEGESAVMAVHGAEIAKAQAAGTPLPAGVQASVAEMRADYEHQLDARYAAARGFVDAIVTAEETRDQVAFLLQVTSRYAGPHLGPFVLPQLDSVGRG